MKEESDRESRHAADPLPSFEKVSEALRSLPPKPTTPPSDFLRRPHRNTLLQSFLSLDTLPLKPWVKQLPAQRGDSCLVWQMFARAAAGKRLRKPCLVAVWDWPSMDLVRIEKIGRITSPAEEPPPVESVMSWPYYEAFCAALDKAGAPPELPPELASQYELLASATVGDGREAVVEPLPKHDARVPVDEAKLDRPSPGFSDLDRISEGLAANAEKLNLKGARERIMDARRLCRRSGFCVAICGEFSRGKSTLANALLGKELIPTGALPTTRFITRIAPASSDRMVWNQPGRPSLALPAILESWNKLSAHLEEGTRGVMRLEVSNEWLCQGVEIIDTPGSNEAGDKGQSASLAAIQCCDAALVCVSATSPLSLSELKLLQDHVLLHEVPRVAVIVTFLDQLKEPADQAAVIDFIRKRLKEHEIVATLGASIERSDLAPGLELDVSGPSEIRKLIRDWALDSGNRNLARGQIHALLLQAQRTGVSTLQQRIELAGKDAELLRKELGDKRDRLRARASTASDLRIEFNERAEKLNECIESAFRDQGEVASEKFGLEVRSGNDPARWLEEFFPFRLKQELKNAARHAERLIRTTLAKDSGWLESELRRRFSGGALAGLPELALELHGAAGNTGIAEGDFGNLRRLQLGARVATGVATVGGWLLVGPLASVISMGGGVASDFLIGKKLKEQGVEVGQKVSAITEAAFRDANRMVREHVNELYSERASECLRLANEWEEQHAKAIDDQLEHAHPESQHTEHLEIWEEGFSSLESLVDAHE